MNVLSHKSLCLRNRLKRGVLALGAELKNTIAFGDGDEIHVSDCHGDLADPESLEKFESATGKILSSPMIDRIESVAVDLHPDMHSTMRGVKIAEELQVPLVRVQHHHAHAAACMAEHGLEKALALVFDGTGLGTDGAIWGSELMLVDSSGFRRLASFAPVPLPGGDAAVTRPLRQLVARMWGTGMNTDEICSALGKDFNYTKDELNMWILQCERKLNAPLSHGAGRLFDSYSAMLGLAPGNISFEAEPAIRLEHEAAKALIRTSALEFSSFSKDEILFIDWSPIFMDFKNIRDGRSSIPELAFAFHKAVAASIVKMAGYGFEKTGSMDIILSGGVFMNRILCGLIHPMLEKMGFKVFLHENIPTGDAGVSVGQAIVVGG